VALRIYLHNKNEEFWLQFIDFPTPTSQFLFDVQSQLSSYGLIRVKSLKTKLYNGGKGTCKDYDNDQFMSCMKEKVEEEIGANVTCKVAGKSFVCLLSLEYENLSNNELIERMNLSNYKGGWLG